MQKPNLTTRCSWVTGDQIYIDYHDHEWGVPVIDDRLLFEMLVLEAFQAGLNWLTILKKREAFKDRFVNFDAHKVKAFDSVKIAELLRDPSIIRHNGKVLAAIHNAERFLAVQSEFGTFAKYLEQYRIPKMRDKSEKLKALAKDLKKRGFKFLGETTVYAYMQAVGLVTEHSPDCFLAKQNTAF